MMSAGGGGITTITRVVTADVNRDGYGDLVTVRFDLNEKNEVLGTTISDIQFGTKDPGKFERPAKPSYRVVSSLFHDGDSVSCKATSPVNGIERQAIEIAKISAIVEKVPVFQGEEVQLIEGVKVFLRFGIEITPKNNPNLRMYVAGYDLADWLCISMAQNQ